MARGHVDPDPTSTQPLLEVEELDVAYGAVRALKGVSLTVWEGQTVALLGANGAGKSTLLRAISGLLCPNRGAIRYEGASLAGCSSHDIFKRGIVQVPEGREVFARMSVEDNLLSGADHRTDRTGWREDLGGVYERYPILRERRLQSAGTLSGGEQQMLAIGRALMGHPRLLMIDEPSLGLAPRIVSAVFETLNVLKHQGVTILLVEQNAWQALGVADHAYVLKVGRIVFQGPASELRGSQQIVNAYLGA